MTSAAISLSPTVDLNLIPLGLIDHIDILKDGASAVYGSDAVGGVFNVSLIHRFRGRSKFTPATATPISAPQTIRLKRLAYVLAGTGDAKTDIVVYAEWYNRDAIYSRDRDISSNADFTRFGGFDERSERLCRACRRLRLPAGALNGGARSPTPHAFADVANDPQYDAALQSAAGASSSLTSLALTPAMRPGGP